jgi:succinyl-CoA synthetase beta subunit
MNIHEYQAKALLKSFGAPVAGGVPLYAADRRLPLPTSCPDRSGW